MTTESIKEPTFILLVEDDRAHRQVYRQVLHGEGYALVAARDRAQAQNHIERQAFPVVILDLMLPPHGRVKGGLTLLSEILEQRPGTKVIVVSRAGDIRFMLDAVKKGAFDFLTKPVEPDVLLEVVRRAVTRFELEGQLASQRSSSTY